MRIGIFSREIQKDQLDDLNLLLLSLKEKKMDYELFEDFAIQLNKKRYFPAQKFKTFKNLKRKKFDLIMSLGGDGTILETVKLVHNRGIPILGINFGRLGFLSSVSVDNIEKAITQLQKKEFKLEERNLIELTSNIPLFKEGNIAINEFTIQRKEGTSLVNVRVMLDGELLNNYWADGIIVATPTGSTGYSLSCGGPIIFPSANDFVITPIAPHNLNVRPIIVSDESTLTIQVEGRKKKFIATLDTRFENITSEHIITLKKASFTSKLIRFDDHGFLTGIKEKLHWGTDLRN